MTTLPQAAQKILDGTAPEPLRKGIAAGAVPMPPADLVSALAVLIARDPDPVLRAKALESLQQMPENVRKAALEGPLAAPVFRVVLKQIALQPDEREAIALNTSAPDEVIAALVERETEGRIVEIIAGNQTRMLRHVPIVEALLESAALGPAAKARIEEFFARAYAGKVLLETGRRTREQLAAEGEWDADLVDAMVKAADDAREAPPEEVPEHLISGDEDEASQLTEEQAEALIAQVDPELLAEALVAEGEDADADEVSSEASEETKGGSIPNIRKMIASMTVGQKIKLALLGTKEARALLIFDSNKVVSSLVLKNPMLSETEAVAIAKSKSVRDDILRGISRDKKFMKSYSVKHALVSNPKTPPTLALSLLPQMREGDLKKLAKSKSVGAAVAAQAKRMLMKKGG